MYKTALTILIAINSLTCISQDWSGTFEEVRGDERFYYYYSYQAVDKGYIIQSVKTSGNDTLETQILTTDKNYNSRKWEYIRENDETHVHAVLEDDKVLFSGDHDGDRINEEFDLDGYPWIQIFPVNPGLNEFIKSGEDEIRFWIIGNAGPADMEINSFVASVEGLQKEKILGEELLCYNIEMTLTGWRSIFWSGNYFYSKKALQVVKYDGGGAPGNPGSTTTLIKD